MRQHASMARSEAERAGREGESGPSATLPAPAPARPGESGPASSTESRRDNSDGAGGGADADALGLKQPILAELEVHTSRRILMTRLRTETPGSLSRLAMVA